jgi:hypothetical protein
MEMKPRHDVAGVGRQFQIVGEFRTAEPYGSGHINDTYAVTYNQAGTPVRYIFQRINHNVFKNPPALMENVQRVTAHLAGKLAGQNDSSRRSLLVIPAGDGRPFVCDEKKNYWRAYLFIENARTYDAVKNPAQGIRSGPGFWSVSKIAG